MFYLKHLKQEVKQDQHRSIIDFAKENNKINKEDNKKEKFKSPAPKPQSVPQEPVRKSAPIQKPVPQQIIQDPSVHYIQKLRNKLLQRLKKQWLSPNPSKKYLSVTEVTGCLLQTWFKLTGNIKESDIDESKLFYLLEFYGKIGDTVHDHLYSLLDFEHTEKDLYDKEHYLRGRFDIIDQGNLIDIKSSMKKNDHSKQLALYVHLARKNGYTVNRAFIWYVMQDTIEEYDMSLLESLIPEMLNRALHLKRSLETNTPPRIIDTEQCKYCPIETLCQRVRQEEGIDENTTEVYEESDGFTIMFDI